ncbi:Bifunctional riboflavin biosynthesis protein RIBA 1, chloroplastic [Morella rubra]|uniref:Bifunctional riboflavin biosynthesis protein RIBA 1, chloroplastic n=1 Tax=Morella rubra TaxID=262757 RepID=A0A6A1W8M2_9ROSI|nr:Bifunctional riboflavin biosynthesis protein RIBA 1, chloroplastic [Morella rubra]
MASINISSPSTTALSRLQLCKSFKWFKQLQSVNLPLAKGYAADFPLIQLGGKFSLNVKGVGRTRATVISGEGNLLSYATNNNVEESVGIEIQPDAVAFGTLAADTSLTDGGFPLDNDEFELDLPTEGFSSIPEAIEDIRQGKLVVVVDDEDRENEGDLIMAAQLATPEAMAFIVKHGTGILCVSMKAEDLERLQLPLMVMDKNNDEKLCTAFTVTVDAKNGTTTGVSARDRATTVLALASRDSKPEDFNRPGHIFPLKYREGGVLKRAGHTEASVDLAMLAGLDPVGVLCEVVDDDGSMARLPKLRQFAEQENLKIISIADLIRNDVSIVSNISVMQWILKWIRNNCDDYAGTAITGGHELFVPGL